MTAVTQARHPRTFHVQSLEDPKMSRRVRKVVIGLALAALLPGGAWADDTCNGFINIDYVGAPPVTNIGDTVRMKISFGTGSILGGSKLNIQSFQLNLDCNANFPLTPPCTDEGAIVQFEDNITTNCPVAVSSLHAISPNPNQVIFNFAGTGLDIPANTPTLPGLCSVEFDVRVLAADTDGSGKIEQLVGYDIATCDNGVLVSGGFQTSAIETPVEARHFDCYQMRQANLRQPKPVVTIQDVFGSYAATLDRAHRLCAPTNKNGEDPAAPGRPEHLAGYEFVNVAPNIPEPDNVHVTTQFGAYTVDVRNPMRLLVPTAKSLTPPPPATIPSGIRHFLCHNLDGVQGPRPTGITVESQLGANVVAVTDLNSATLCAPVNKNGGDPGALADPGFLMCFRTNEQANFGTQNVFLNNQFGPSTTQFTGQPFLTQYDEHCVPASLS